MQILRVARACGVGGVVEEGDEGKDVIDVNTFLSTTITVTTETMSLHNSSGTPRTHAYVYTSPHFKHRRRLNMTVT